MPAAVANCVVIEPTEEEPPYTMRVLFEDADPRQGYGRLRAGVDTPGIAVLGFLTESAHTAASIAKAATTPSLNGMASGRIAALSAGIAVYRANAPSRGLPVTRLIACLSLR
jgi:hypothetical protein